MKKYCFLFFWFVYVFSFKIARCQVIDTPIAYFVVQPKVVVIDSFKVSGRVIGFNLEDLSGAIVTDMCSGQRVSTDSRGMYQLTVAKNDTVFFQYPHHSDEQRAIKRPQDKLNIILVKRQTDGLPANHSRSDYDKARRADEDFYRILEKDAKLEGKWNY